MLKNIVPTLIERAIPVTALFKSELFRFSFDNDEWPANHTNDTELLRPFNENIFLLGRYYDQVFPENEFRPIDDMSESEKAKLSSKIYKIRYSCNLLPLIGGHLSKTKDIFSDKEEQIIENRDINLLELCASSDEIELFSAKAV